VSKGLLLVHYRKNAIVKLSLKKYALPKNYNWVIIIEKLLLMMIYIENYYKMFLQIYNKNYWKKYLKIIAHYSRREGEEGLFMHGYYHRKNMHR
jgi:hypothetical protein